MVSRDGDGAGLLVEPHDQAEDGGVEVMWSLGKDLTRKAGTKSRGPQRIRLLDDVLGVWGAGCTGASWSGPLSHSRPTC